MAMTDPADMLTRIRNANTAGHAKVEIPASKMKKSVAEILKNEGIHQGLFSGSGQRRGTITVELKHGPNMKDNLRDQENPSQVLRVYAKADQAPPRCHGLESPSLKYLLL